MDTVGNLLNVGLRQSFAARFQRSRPSCVGLLDLGYFPFHFYLSGDRACSAPSPTSVFPHKGLSSPNLNTDALSRWNCVGRMCPRASEVDDLQTYSRSQPLEKKKNICKKLSTIKSWCGFIRQFISLEFAPCKLRSPLHFEDD